MTEARRHTYINHLRQSKIRKPLRLKVNESEKKKSLLTREYDKRIDDDD